MSLTLLRDALAAQGGTLARVLVEDPGLADRIDVSGQRAPAAGVSAVNGDRSHDGDGDAPGLGAPQLAARGPRTVAHAQEYELLLEIILEGSLLHYGHPRVVSPPTTATWRCCSATSCTRSDSNGWPSSVISNRSASCRT